MNRSALGWWLLGALLAAAALAGGRPERPGEGAADGAAALRAAGSCAVGDGGTLTHLP